MNKLYKYLQQCPFLIAVLCIVFLNASDLPVSAAQPDEILSKIENETRASNTDELVLIKDRKVIFQYSSGRFTSPILAMSASKSIVALAVGLAIDDGALKSVDERVSDFFPEWQNDHRNRITVRHLLNHTSGIRAKKTTEDIYLEPDFVKHALRADLTSNPGADFFYNNRATNLLPAVLQMATGKRMDVYLREKLFRKLGVNDADWFWQLDKAGNPYGMSGLYIRPLALAAVGQLILQNGLWNGKQIISRKWLKEMLTPGQQHEPGCGYLWWLKSNPEEDQIYFDDQLISQYKENKVSEIHLKRLQPMVGRTFFRNELKNRLLAAFGSKENAQSFLSEISRLGLPDGKLKTGPVSAYVAEGYLGQFLVIIPKKKIVAVRMLHHTSTTTDSNFQTFPGLVQNLDTHTPTSP